MNWRKKQGVLSESEVDEGEDRISHLPDSVFSHILSFLPILTAGTTRVLSSRWRNLWPSVTNLKFEFCDYNYRHDVEWFTDFVDGVMINCEALKIHSFRLKSWKRMDCSRVYNWICSAIMWRVEVLDLTLNMTDPIYLPRSFFFCKSLVGLVLNGEFVLDVPFRACFPSLKRLDLRSVLFVDDESVERLFCGCPMLEELIVFRTVWDGVRVFKISSHSLKMLYLQVTTSYWTKSIRNYEYVLVLDAPNLAKLELHDDHSENFLICNLQSVIDATIDVLEPDSDWAIDGTYSERLALTLLAGISNTRSLSLSGDTLQALCVLRDYKLPTFHSLTHLGLHMNVIKHGWYLFGELLHSMPNLEVLVFERGLVDLDVMDSDFIQTWNIPFSVSSCLLLHVKTIEIFEFVLRKDELLILLYLLAIAKVLQKITVHCGLYLSRDTKYQKELFMALQEKQTISVFVMSSCPQKTKDDKDPSEDVFCWGERRRLQIVQFIFYMSCGPLCGSSFHQKGAGN
ncbi:Leucine-rich repeat 2 [Dillenia turbinata]|uniref:Leucine-rich repeat 2 n=1 Tax=Dillenia turbinata TaxID=194707 RepID=A0AAN8ZHQ3_9MAGN